MSKVFSVIMFLLVLGKMEFILCTLNKNLQKWKYKN
jgi:hypothetical protein